MSSRHITTIAIAMLVAGSVLQCDKGKSDGSRTADLQPSSSASVRPTEPNAPIPGASPASSADAAGDPGPAEWYACDKPEDCVVVNHGRCCPPCDPLNFRGYYAAVNGKFTAQYIEHEGCANAQCPACPRPAPGNPRSDSNFFAICEQQRCEAVDLRFSKYAQCTTSKDCALRFGIGCCEGCGDKDLVTYNPASSLEKDVCTTKPKCPPLSAQCKANRFPHRTAECVVDRCQLGD